MNYTRLLALLILCFITIMNASPQNIEPKQTRSNIDNASIDSLTSRIDSLNRSADWWNSGYLLFVTLSVILAGVTVYFQYTAVNKARLLADAQAQLSRAKEQQLSGDLKDKDLKIAGLNKVAGELNKTAEEARERAAKAEAQVASANAASKDAVVKVSAAEARIAEANRASAEANARAAEANRISEAERLARLQLEARLADRTLTPTQQQQLTKLLSAFPKTDVDVVIFGDSPEIEIIAGMTVDCMAKAGWNLHIGHAGGSGMAVRGILVGVRQNADSSTMSASSALISGLRSFGIDSGPWDFDQLRYPSPLFNTSITETAPLKVFIGSKPQ